MRAIVVCDDDSRRVHSWAERVAAVVNGDEWTVSALDPTAFAGAFAVLKARKANARGLTAVVSDTETEAIATIDSADVLLVDYDLTPDSADTISDLTESAVRELTGESGEGFAYLARSYSSARAIAVVNQRWKRSTFDLTLQALSQSFADVNVASEDLTRTGLWNGAPDGFRPWAWPALLDLPDAFERRASSVVLDDVVFEVLGFADEAHLVAFTQAQLDPLGDKPELATFRDVACNPEFGLAPKDAFLDDEHAQRIAAAGVTRWLERYVLPGQNVLIDAPHLVQRYPSLLRGDPGDITAWNATTSLRSIEDALDVERIETARTVAENWCFRPVFSWPSLTASGLANSLRSGAEEVRFVFCEDTSSFLEVQAAQEVETDVRSPYRNRFVSEIDGVDYHPRGRLLLL